MHSVFSKAVNILIDGHFCTLLKHENLLSPFSLVTSELFQQRLDLKNQVVYFEPSRVKIGDLASIEVSCQVVSLGLSQSFGSNLAEATRLREFLLEFGQSEGLLGVLSEKGGSIWSEKARNLLDKSDLRSCAKLVGLGIGWTPSGDDFLCGVLLGLDLLGKTKEFEKIAGSLDLERTSLGGKSLLLGAKLKKYPLAFLDFAKNWASGRLDKKIFSFGSTSGTDFACGFCWVMIIFNERKVR